MEKEVIRNPTSFLGSTKVEKKNKEESIPILRGNKDYWVLPRKIVRPTRTEMGSELI